MSIPDVVPLAAYALLWSSCVPAILRMRRNKSSKDVSLAWQCMILTGVTVIAAYAVQVGNPVWVVGGILNILSVGSVVVVAAKYRKCDK